VGVIREKKEQASMKAREGTDSLGYRNKHDKEHVWNLMGNPLNL
jgi:hypothetical protein